MKSIFKGKKVKEVYWFGRDCFGFPYFDNVIRNNLETIGHETFLEVDLKEPQLKTGDNFYVHETEESFHIENAMRGTNDTMVYFTDKILERTIDEESKRKAEEDKRKYEEEQKEKSKKVEEDMKYIEKSRKSWWEKIFNK